MIKLRNLSLMLLVLTFVGGCASKTPKETEANAVTRVPPPLFGPTDATNLSKVVESKDKTTSREGMTIPELRVIYFDYDMSDITLKARSTLEEHAKYLSSNPMIAVRLEGHADERGSREYNLALGELRAEEARNLLLNLGIADNQLETISYGEEQPVALGHGEQSWWQNRRVEFIYP